MKALFALLTLVWLLSGCAFPTELFFEPPPVGQPGEATPRFPTPTFTVLSSITPPPPTQLPCAYVWATKDLPDETALVQEALQKAGLGLVEVTLNAYGENCVDTQNKKVVSFATLQTDFYFNVPVNDLNDLNELGNWTAQILEVVRQFPPGKIPGSNPGQCGLTFQTIESETVLRFPSEVGLRALDAGLSGAALYTTLRP